MTWVSVLAPTRNSNDVLSIRPSRSTGRSARSGWKSDAKPWSRSLRRYTGIINSGRFLEEDHGTLGRHDRRRRDPGDLARVLARGPIRGTHRGPREGGRRGRAHLAPEHGRRPPAVLPGPGRAQALRPTLAGRARHVGGVRRHASPALAPGVHVRGRDPARGRVPPREVHEMGPRERDGRRRTGTPHRVRCAAVRAEHPMPWRDLVEDGYRGGLRSVHE